MHPHEGENSRRPSHAQASDAADKLVVKCPKDKEGIPKPVIVSDNTIKMSCLPCMYKFLDYLRGSEKRLPQWVILEHAVPPECPREAGKRVTEPTTVTLRIHDHRTATIFTELVALDVGTDGLPTYRRIENGDERLPSSSTPCAEPGSPRLVNTSFDEAGSTPSMSSFYADVGYEHMEDMDSNWI